MTELNELYTLGNTIDTFALGHYARVYDAVDRRTDQPCALKIMRVEHIADGDGQPHMEAWAFMTEADLLLKMESPHVVQLYDCGYLRSTDENPRGGEIVSFGRALDEFRKGAYRYAGQRWRPYLALEILPRTENLLYVMRSNKAGARWRLPTEEAIDLAGQFGDLLVRAHGKQIVYLDHKLEHVYWDGRRLRIIDWNSSRLIESSAQLSHQIASDIHNLCVGILYPIFTGLSPQKGSLVPQPAAQSEVEARYSDIAQLDFGVEPTLSAGLQALMQDGAERKYPSADHFLVKLSRAAAAYGWDESSKTLREGRWRTREALSKLRAGQDSIREARDLIYDAAILDDMDADFEAELRRLLAKINDMLNGRVIP
jgi:serine/threonine protein kinase